MRLAAAPAFEANVLPVGFVRVSQTTCYLCISKPSVLKAGGFIR